VDRDRDFLLVSAELDPYRRTRGTVLDRVADQVGEGLADPRGVPLTDLSLARASTWIFCSGCAAMISSTTSWTIFLQVHLRSMDRDASAEAAPGEVQKVADHVRRAHCAVGDPRR
jgi:hypothetical protein